MGTDGTGVVVVLPVVGALVVGAPVVGALVGVPPALSDPPPQAVSKPAENTIAATAAAALVCE
ncbi:hypothetical protein ACI2LF_22480 [Kribbella sp. NPDC020789]